MRKMKMIKKRKLPWLPCDPLYLWRVCAQDHIWPTLRITQGKPNKCPTCDKLAIFITQTKEEAELEIS